MQYMVPLWFFLTACALCTTLGFQAGRAFRRWEIRFYREATSRHPANRSRSA